jgi:hypothetical protein
MDEEAGPLANVSGKQPLSMVVSTCLKGLKPVKAGMQQIINLVIQQTKFHPKLHGFRPYRPGSLRLIFSEVNWFLIYSLKNDPADPSHSIYNWKIFHMRGGTS